MGQAAVERIAGAVRDRFGEEDAREVAHALRALRLAQEGKWQRDRSKVEAAFRMMEDGPPVAEARRPARGGPPARGHSRPAPSKAARPASRTARRVGESDSQACGPHGGGASGEPYGYELAFGKHKGKTLGVLVNMGDEGVDYLRFLLHQEWLRDDTRAAIEELFDREGIPLEGD